MIDATGLDALLPIVFAPDGLRRFAVLDGCMVEKLPARLARSGCEHRCLFSGALDPMLRDAAPWLVALPPHHDFTLAVLREGWNDHWGVVAATDPGLDIDDLRHHLRKFLRVAGPSGQPFYFRFYDPRAFRQVAPTMPRATLREFLGPIRKLYAEGGEPNLVQVYTAHGPPDGTAIPLAQPATA